jgi:hypothetical protein
LPFCSFIAFSSWLAAVGGIEVSLDASGNQEIVADS